MGVWRALVLALALVLVVGGGGSGGGVRAQPQRYVCAPGPYAGQNNMATCGYQQLSSGSVTICAPGTYSAVTLPGTGAWCYNCPAGSITNLPGQVACNKCSPGTYATSLTLCTSVSVNSWGAVQSAMRSGMTAPDPVNNGFFSDKLRSYSCGPGEIRSGSNPFTGAISTCYAPGQSCCVPVQSQFAGVAVPFATDEATNPLLMYGYLPGAGNPWYYGGNFQVVCPAGTYVDATTFAPTKPTQCVLCPAGKTTPTYGMRGVTSCQNCAAGTYFGGVGGAFNYNYYFPPSFTTMQYPPPWPGTGCTSVSAGYRNTIVGGGDMQPTKCVPGTFSTGGANTCNTCPAGRFTPINAAPTSACYQCLAGWEPTTAKSGCVQCPTGRFSTTGGVCTNCPPGTFAAALGTASACTTCPPGFYSASGWQQCQPCPAGTFTTDNKVCLPCPVGTYGAGAGLSACPACLNGKYTDTPGSLNCTECATMTSPLPCMTCADGKYQAFLGSAACSDCDATSAGKIACCPKYRTCSICPAGRMATYDSATQTGACTACTAGKFQTRQAQTTCSECADGSYNALPAQITCTYCSPGNYSNATTGHTYCASCEAGKFSFNNYTACRTCEWGKYSTGAASVCSDCGAGTYTATNGTVTCTPCGPGTYASLGGLTTCTQCWIGSYVADYGRFNCTLCPLGKYGTAYGQPNCTDCPSGTYGPAAGATSCVPCSNNTFSGNTGQTACDACVLGTAAQNLTIFPFGGPFNASFKSYPGKGACATCPPGSFANRYAQDGCQLCSAGYASPGGNATCNACPAGQWTKFQGNSSCFNCSAGYFQTNTGQTFCDACPPGRSSLPGASYCFECPHGYIAASSGSPSCTICGNTQYTETAGSTACLPCLSAPPNSKAAKILCKICQPGTMVKTPSGCTDCPAGSAQPASGQTVCPQCVQGKFATSTASITCQECTVGTASNELGRNATCDACSAGYFADVTGLTGCKQCGLGTFSGSPGAITCTLCPLGRYLGNWTVTLGTVCQDCPGGTYAFAAGSWNCTACPLGKATGSSGRAACTDCGKGFKANVTGLLSCLQCPAGTSSDAGQSSCYDCPVGQYSFSPASTSCLDCPVGRYNPRAGSTVCVNCELGKYGDVAGLSTCALCSAGTYNDKTAQVACTICPPGKYNRLINATVCTDCDIGFFRPDVSDPLQAVNCTRCPLAQYGVQPGQASCLRCASGTDTNTTGQTTCVNCKAGRFSNFEQTNGSCLPAPPGSISVVDGLSYASACPRGRYQPDAGQQFCIPCEVGKSSGNGAVQCTSCPQGTFANINGSSTCVACQAGSYAEGVGSDKCVACPDDSVADSNLTTCLCRADYSWTQDPAYTKGGTVAFGCRQCPEGADCRQPGANYSVLLPQPGYWPALHGQGLNFIKCVNGACLGGPAATQCKPGYEGNLCTVCSITDTTHYGRTGFYDCDVCPSPALNRLRLVGFVVVLLVVTVIITRVTLSSSRKATKSSILLKILLSNLQFNALALSFAFTWPPSIQAVFNLFDYGSNVTGFISIDCFLGETNTLSPFYVKTAVILCLLPTIIILPALLGFLPYGLFERCYYGHLPAERVRELRDLYISGITIVLFLLHPNVTSLALSMFSCMQLGTEPDDLYLIPDMSQQCYTPFHKKMIYILTIPLVTLFVVGIPVAAFFILWANRHKIEYDSPEFKERFGFLYNGYKTHFWFWEFVVVARKVLLVSVSVYFSENQNVQALMAVLLCAAALTAHSAARPFGHASLNAMEFLSLVSSFFTFFFGQFLFIRVSSDVQMAASAMVLFVNLGYVLLVIAVWVYWFKLKLERLKKKQLKKKSEKDAARKVPWTEGDWRFHLQSGTKDLDEKEREYGLHSSEAPVNGMVFAGAAEPQRAPRQSVVAMAAAHPQDSELLDIVTGGGDGTLAVPKKAKVVKAAAGTDTAASAAGAAGAVAGASVPQPPAQQ